MKRVASRYRMKSLTFLFTGHYYFKKGVEVLGDLPHMGHVNGIDLSVLDMLVAKVDRENVIQSNLDIESVSILQSKNGS